MNDMKVKSEREYLRRVQSMEMDRANSVFQQRGVS